MKVFVALAVIAFVGAALVEGRSIRDLKSTLTTKGNELVKRADEAITKLQADHKTHQVAALKAEEATIKKLLADLETADAAHLTRIEHELARAETKLQHQLDHLAHVSPHPHTHAPPTTKATPAKRDLKADLLTKATALLKRADEDIKKLDATKNAHEVSIIKHEEAAIKKLVSAVEAETDAAKLTHLEHQLAQAEHRLQFELLKIEHGHPHPHTQAPTTKATPAKRDLKSDLLTKAKNLETKAEAEIKRLLAGFKNHEASIIKHEEAVIKKLVSAVEAETDAAKLTALEHQLTQAEHKLATELQKIHSGPHPHTQKPTTAAF